MADLNFSQPERRSYLIPILGALGVFAVAIVYNYYFLPHRIADITVTHTAILPTHTVFKSGSIVVGAPDQAQDDLYVLATVRIQDDLKLPLFIKDITGILTAADGTQFTASAVQKNDLAGMYVTFPALKPLAGPPLLRETTIAPGQQAEGMVLLSFPVPKPVWDMRRSADVTIDFYHQGPLTESIPRP